MHKPTSASGKIQGKKGDAGSKDPFTEEVPGWVWILTVNEELDGAMGEMIDEDETGEDIIGCYATKELLYAEAKSLKLGNFNVHHMKVEGWMVEKAVQS